MRAWVLVAPLASAGCLEAGSPPDPMEEPDADPRLDRATSPTVASMVTWNLKTFPLHARTPSIVASLLEGWQDDLIAVQEIVDVDTFEAMVGVIPGYASVVNDDPGGWMRLGLVYNTERVEVSEVETLFAGDFYAFPRPPLKAHVTIRLAEREAIDFIVVVVHHKSQVGEDTRDRRRAAADALHQWITETIDSGDERDVVVLGDWNEEVTAPAESSPWAVFLTDPDAFTFLTYEDQVDGGYTQLGFKSFLDHVLVTTDALDEVGSGDASVVEAQMLEDRYDQTVSDHLPVRALFAPAAPPRRVR